jgi:hypothetical protein
MRLGVVEALAALVGSAVSLVDAADGCAGAVGADAIVISGNSFCASSVVLLSCAVILNRGSRTKALLIFLRAQI